MGSIRYGRPGHIIRSPRLPYRLPPSHPMLSRRLRHLNRGLRPLAAAPPIGYWGSTNTENYRTNRRRRRQEGASRSPPRRARGLVRRSVPRRGPVGRQPRRCDPPPPHAPSRARRRCRTNPLLAMHSFGCRVSAARLRVLWPMSRCGPEAGPWTRSWRRSATLRLDSRNRWAPSSLSAPPRRWSMPSPCA